MHSMNYKIAGRHYKEGPHVISVYHCIGKESIQQLLRVILNDDKECIMMTKIMHYYISLIYTHKHAPHMHTHTHSMIKMKKNMKPICKRLWYYGIQVEIKNN